MPNSKKPPSKAEIELMEPFDSLGRGEIVLVTDATAAVAAFAELSAVREIGFDTESKPTFHKGQKSEGPHVLQFATVSKAFIFQTRFEDTVPVIVQILKSPELVKIGFGLKGDLSQIQDRFGIRPAAIVDVDRAFRSLGYRGAVGVKSAVAILFKRKFRKSKSLSMSNWAAPVLSEGQLLYAANDACAAIRVHHALREAGA